MSEVHGFLDRSSSYCADYDSGSILETGRNNLMGYRVKIKVGKRTLYSRSYATKKKAESACKRLRGGKSIVKS